ncbi:uncharacterized protein F4812DRAFT_442620 [Daldinia caldariorum]|uniref:uncharacterized protein n=1 Tax=Daldinia caldariorum TaxID=326644 RepID=UPI0020078522|nr:uncharacterized protein F4812DRAFT_442620 [Daldinia caldariorum]KAI1464549.1 hypothetical protein F4812DRAFT_442620 [Daldinia caldariorum]
MMHIALAAVKLCTYFYISMLSCVLLPEVITIRISFLSEVRGRFYHCVTYGTGQTGGRWGMRTDRRMSVAARQILITRHKSLSLP